MSDEGYSSIVDAVLFLMLVGACAVIMGPAISGHVTESASTDRGMHELAGDVLLSLDTGRADYFEYRILGDAADRIAGAGGVNATENILYKDLSKALLGRGDRHLTVMEIAAGDAACQFTIGCGNGAVRMNPVTIEYDSATTALIDQTIRSMLDSRYDYAFTLRWTPFAGVPLAGEAEAGSVPPAGAASVSMQVAIPYVTSITRGFLEQASIVDLDDIGEAIDEYRAGGDAYDLRDRIGQAIDRCLRNSTALMANEIWNNTLGTSALAASGLDPLRELGRFTGTEATDELTIAGLNVSWKGAVEGLAVAYYRSEGAQLADDIVAGAMDDSLDAGGAVQMVVDWLQSRYRPSSAIATISIWTEPYA